MKKRVFVTLVSIFTFSACGKKEDKKTTVDQAQTDLAGTWTLCENGTDSSNKATYVVSGGSYKMTVNLVLGTDCNGTADIIIVQEGTISGGSDSAVTGAKKLDVVRTVGSVTPKTDNGVSLANQLQLCEGVTFAKDTAVDSIGKKCFDEPAIEKGSIEYTIYKIDGTKLYLGDDEDATNDGSTEAKRTSKLETKTFTKQ